jgi:hypothetical protein
MTSFFHFGPKERKMSGRPELDLKNFQELRLDLFKKVLHFIRVLDQGPSYVEDGSRHPSDAVVDHLRQAWLSLWMQGQMRATLRG